jgi:Zn-dependent protease with chaperone function
VSPVPPGIPSTGVPAARHIALRAASLLLLWAGFYVLGLSVVAGLLWVPWAQVSYGAGLDAGGALAGAGGIWLLWGLRPRFRGQPDRGLPLPLSRHAKLHALVADVARRAGHAVPHELHLLPDANAFAGQHGRFLRRRTSLVGIGLPYLAWLDRPGIEAIIAHELGHHVAGDVRLGPWVHRTRSLMGQTLDHLEGSAFWLDLPFVGYARGFVRYSSSVSRAQEVAADAISARVAGAEAAARALVVTQRSDLWQAYMTNEIEPMLNAGFLPELLKGFEHFEAALSEQLLEPDVGSTVADTASSFDTHPTLAERLAALGVPKPKVTERRSSLELLDATRDAEEYVLRRMLKNPELPLQPLTWADAGKLLWLPRFRRTIAPFAHAFATTKPEDMPAVVERADQWAEALRTGLALFSNQAKRRHVVGMFGTWLCVQLADLGFAIEALPGAPVRASRGSLTLEPFNEIRDLFDGKIDRTAWAARCSAVRAAAAASC